MDLEENDHPAGPGIVWSKKLDIKEINNPDLYIPPSDLKGPFPDGTMERLVKGFGDAPDVIVVYSLVENQSTDYVVSSVRILTEPHTILKV